MFSSGEIGEDAMASSSAIIVVTWTELSKQILELSSFKCETKRKKYCSQYTVINFASRFRRCQFEIVLC